MTSTHFYFPIILSSLAILLFLSLVIETFADTSSQNLDVFIDVPTLSIVPSLTSGGADIGLFTPNEGGDKVLYVSGSAQYDVGCEDLNDTSLWTASVYRSSVANGFECTPNSSNCFQAVPASQLTFSGCTGPGDDTLTYEWMFFLPHYIDPTDIGQYETSIWKARVKVISTSGESAPAIANFDVATVRALDVSDGIDYGTLSLGSTSDQRIITVTNTGNESIDLNIKSSGALMCTRGSIPVGNVHMHTANGFSYSSPLLAMTTIDAAVNTSMAKRVSTPSTKELYFKIQIPSSGLAGVCNNTLSFTAKEDQ